MPGFGERRRLGGKKEGDPMCDVPTGRGNKRFPKFDYFDDKDVGDKGVRGKSNFVDVAHANPLAVAERRLHSISSRVRERETLSRNNGRHSVSGKAKKEGRGLAKG